MKRIVLALLISILLHATVLYFLGLHSFPKPEPTGGQSTTIALVNLQNSRTLSDTDEVSLPTQAFQMSKKDFFDAAVNLEPVPETKTPDTNKDVNTNTPLKKPVKDLKPVKEKVPQKPEQDQKKEQPEDLAPTESQVENVAAEGLESRAKVPENKIQGEIAESLGASDQEQEKIILPLVLDAEKAGVIKRVKPSYPRASRLKREEGEVILLLEIEKGQVVEVMVESSSNFPRLDSSAVDAVRKWTFSYPSKAKVRIPVIFRLEDQ